MAENEKISVELTPGEAALLAKMRAFAVKASEPKIRCRVLMEISLSQPSPSQGEYREEFEQNMQQYLAGSMAIGPWKRVPPGVVLDLYASDFANFSKPSPKAPKGRVEKVSDKTPLTPVSEYEAMLTALFKRHRDMGRLKFLKDQAGLDAKEQAEFEALLDEYGPEKGLGAKIRGIFGHDDEA